MGAVEVSDQESEFGKGKCRVEPVCAMRVDATL